MRRLAVAILPVAFGLGLGVGPGGPAGSAAPPPRCDGLVATIVAPPGGGTVRGTAGPDVIVGSGHNDLILPGGGDDVVCGRAGNDSVDDSPWDDRVFGGAGRDVIESYRGSDVLRGGTGDDDLSSDSKEPSRLYGGPGSDRLLGNVTDAPGYVFDAGGGEDVTILNAVSEGAAVEIRRGARTIVRDGVVTGTYRGAEGVLVRGLSPFVYVGTDARDFVMDGTDLPFRAMTYGGPDHVDTRGAAADDYLDLGAGDDTAKAGLGTDTCLHAERTTGCETVSP